jgi:F-type H+-transporting ATPase subunit a
MRTLWKVLIILLVVFAVIVAGNLTFPRDLPPIELRAEKIPGLTLPLLGPVTNALLGSVVTSLFLITIALLARSNLQLVPTGLQNFVEFVLEFIYGLVESVAGEERAPRFFPLIATIFIFVLVSNWMDVLVPMLAWVGVREVHHGHEVIVPILRSPSTDLNFTLALAFISVIATQIYGLRALGPIYFMKFFNVGGFIKIFQIRQRGCLAMLAAFQSAAIDFFVSLVELVAELARLASFSFRLFGNLFAGEVVLLIISSLVPFILILPFMGLEIFVGFMQAFIFAVLTLAFITVATTPHGGGEHH